MYQKERLSKLMTIISKKKIVDIKELEQLAFVSRSTLRRDLIQLEKEKKLIRHFGQVELVRDTNIEFGYNIRLRENEDAKKAMAEIAGDFIGSSQALFIDSSSTCIHLAPYLQNQNNLIVITNGIHLAAVLTEHPNIETFICGGHVKSLSGSILGGEAVGYLNNFHADITFLSCTGVDEHGVYMASEEQTFIKRKMIELSEHVVLLCDTSKVNKKDYFRMCGHENIDTLITNAPLPEEIQRVLEAKDVEVLY
ncbi:MAG: DeoR/GlpR family DNA-binding transcription regulator [Enterococcus devriesei]|uniref:DeoR/GlpR family DNA-binding transcription regulator n=1 Tax=Enterococcus devriesei TaxID=319970 RepID=UPI003F906685